MATAGEFSSRVLEASEAGEKFVDAFYESMDKRRNVRLFLSNANWYVHRDDSSL